jgi:Site-specific recombinase XerD
VNGRNIVGEPKTAAGVRTIALPPHIAPMLEGHLRDHTGKNRGALLFPCQPGSDEPWTNGGPFARVFAVARAAAERDDLRFHDLRHTGAVLAAQSGATLKELMQRLGHSTPTMALRYQHVAEGRDAAIAKAMSDLAANRGDAL